MMLEIVTPKKVIKEEGIDFVSLEGTDGSLGILPGHIPIIAELKIAPLHYDKNKSRETVAVMGGIVKVMSDVVTIITEDAEKATEIDVLLAKKEKEEAEAYLTKKAEIADILKAEIALRRALVRLKVAETSNK
jgi:F-type H+-transporting ATPase subunit epsilon